jgi:hypothetical protein
VPVRKTESFCTQGCPWTAGHGAALEHNRSSSSGVRTERMWLGRAWSIIGGGMWPLRVARKFPSVWIAKTGRPSLLAVYNATRIASCTSVDCRLNTMEPCLLMPVLRNSIIARTTSCGHSFIKRTADSWTAFLAHKNVTRASPARNQKGVFLVFCCHFTKLSL